MVRVGRVNDAVNASLDQTAKYRDLWIVGEVSDVHWKAGNVYFSLNDWTEVARIRVVMLGVDRARLAPSLRNGERVKVRGNLNVHRQSGAYGLRGKFVQLVGEGDLARRFAETKAKLDAEGLLAQERKRPLPRVPRVVGVVTSRSGAALRDVLRVADGRAPVRIVVADCRVQGDRAPREIEVAIRSIQRVPDLDVVIVTRGGGSAEDLWAFNEERVARAIAACRVPVVSGVGHERDICLSDLVADVRAATPSNAAELVVPEMETLRRQVRELDRRLHQSVLKEIRARRLSLSVSQGALRDPRAALKNSRVRLERVNGKLVGAQRGLMRARRRGLGKHRERLTARDPRAVLRRDAERLGGLRARLEQAARKMVGTRRASHGAALLTLVDRDPRRQVQAQRAEVAALHARLVQQATRDAEARRGALMTGRARVLAGGRPLLRRARGRLGGLAGKLSTLSPLSVLERGYAIVLADGREVRSVTQVEPGDEVVVRVMDGELQATVTDKKTIAQDELSPDVLSRREKG